MKKQMSESLLIGTLLAVSGGLMDAYSYLFRGQVFANAQTGNILLLSVHLAQQEWRLALQYACPVIAFSIGIAWATITRHISKRSGWLHWRQICVLFEATVFFAVGWFPQSMNLFANSLISLACGIQVETFRIIAEEISAACLSTSLRLIQCVTVLWIAKRKFPMHIVVATLVLSVFRNASTCVPQAKEISELANKFIDRGNHATEKRTAASNKTHICRQ